MLEHDLRVVIGGHSRAHPTYAREYPVDRPQQVEGLVDEVRTEVVEQAGQILRRALLAPAALGCRAPALEARLEAVRRTDESLVDGAAGGEDLGVPSPVLEDVQLATLRGCEVDQGLRLARRTCQWLVDHDVHACVKRRGGLANVGGVGRGHDGHVRSAGPRLLCRVEDGDPGQVSARLRLALRV